jgi:hypothetical protein
MKKTMSTREPKTKQKRIGEKRERKDMIESQFILKK